MCIKSQTGISGLFTKPVYDVCSTRAVSKELRWQVPVVPRVSTWQPGKTTFGKSSVPMSPSHGINNPELIALELQSLGLHSTGREKTQHHTAIWNKSCLLLALVPSPLPKFNGIKPWRGQATSLLIFSNVNERPSRDILFLIKLEETYSRIWVNRELWDAQEPSSGSAPTKNWDSACPTAKGLTSYLVPCISLPFSLWTNHLLEFWKRKSHICTDKSCRINREQAQFQELNSTFSLKETRLSFFTRRWRVF